MSNGFNIGGASIQLKRDVGTANAVQGFRTSEITQGPRLTSSLSTVYKFFAADGVAQLSQVAALVNRFWKNISGVWKVTVSDINISNVYKNATPRINISNLWK